jgi:hypothetical protein
MNRTIGLLLILLGLVLNHATTTNVRKSSEDENSECLLLYVMFLKKLRKDKVSSFSLFDHQGTKWSVLFFTIF